MDLLGKGTVIFLLLETLAGLGKASLRSFATVSSVLAPLCVCVCVCRVCVCACVRVIVARFAAMLQRTRYMERSRRLRVCGLFDSE